MMWGVIWMFFFWVFILALHQDLPFSFTSMGFSWFRASVGEGFFQTNTFVSSLIMSSLRWTLVEQRKYNLLYSKGPCGTSIFPPTSPPFICWGRFMFCYFIFIKYVLAKWIKIIGQVIQSLSSRSSIVIQS